VSLDPPEDVQWFDGHGATVTSIAWDREGKRVVSGSYDRTARLWDVFSKKCVGILEGHRDSVLSVRFDRSGTRILTGAGAPSRRADNTARVWHTETIEVLQTLKFHRGGVEALDVSDDGSLIATGGGDGVAGLWDAVTGVMVYSFERDHRRHGVRRSVGDSVAPRTAFVPGGSGLALAWRDGCVRVYSTHSGEMEWERWVGAELSAMDISDDGSLLAIALEPGEIVILDRRSGDRVDGVQLSAKNVMSVAFHPSGTSLAVGSDQGVQIYELKSTELSGEWNLAIVPPLSARGLLARARKREELVRRLSAGDGSAYGPLQSLRDETPEFQRDGVLAEEIHRVGISLGVAAGMIDVWVDQWVQTQGDVQSVCLPGDGQWVGFAELESGELTFSEWRKESGIARVKCARGAGRAALSWSADGKLVFAAGGEGPAGIYRASTGRCLATLSDASPRVTAAAFDPTGRFVLTGNEDGTIRLWTVERGTLVRTLRGHRHAITSLALGAGGALALTGGWDSNVRYWDLSLSQCVRDFDAFQTGVVSVALAPDGRRAVIAGQDGVRVFSTAADESMVLEGHGAGVTSVLFTPGGRYIVTAGWEGVVSIYRAVNGARVRTFGGHFHGVTGIAISPDGHRLVTIDGARTVRVWVMDWDWIFAEQIVSEVEKLLSDPSGSRYGVAKGKLPDLDVLLDAWEDLRVAMDCNESDSVWTAKGQLVRTRLAERIEASMRECTDDHVMDRVGRVDPALAFKTRG
jgi:WD40 repeat protein